MIRLLLALIFIFAAVPAPAYAKTYTNTSFCRTYLDNTAPVCQGDWVEYVQADYIYNPFTCTSGVPCPIPCGYKYSSSWSTCTITFPDPCQAGTEKFLGFTDPIHSVSPDPGVPGHVGLVPEFIYQSTPSNPNPVKLCADPILCFGYGCMVESSQLCMFEGVLGNYWTYQIEGQPRQVGALMLVQGRFRTTGQTCSIPSSNGKVISAGDVPSLPQPSADPPPGCPAGQHNNNATPPICVPDTLTCPSGQHVVYFGSEIGEVCIADTAPTGGEGQNPNPNGACNPPLVNVNGVCSPPVDGGDGGIVIGGGGGGVPSGGATQSGQCGAPGFPPCSTDIGALLGQQGEMGDPASKTSSDVLAALNIESLNPLKTFAVPSHSSSCPTLDFTVPFWNKSFHIDQHCALIESVSGLIGIISMLGWFLSAMFIVLSA